MVELSIDDATIMTSFDVGHVASILQDDESTEQDKFVQLKELKSVLSNRCQLGDALLDNTTARYLCRALLDCFSNRSSLGLAEEAVFLLGQVMKTSCSNWEASMRAEVLGTCIERVVDIVGSSDQDSNRLHTAHNLLQHVYNLDSEQVVTYFMTDDGYSKLKIFMKKCVDLAREDEVAASLKTVTMRVFLLALKGGPPFVNRLQKDVDFWLILLFPQLFFLNSWHVRSVTVEIFKILTTCKLLNGETAISETMKQDIKVKYVPAMLELVGSEDWCDLWSLTVEFLGNDLLADRSTQDIATVKLFNRLLTVSEKAFKSADPGTRLQAFDSWKWLIEKFFSRGSDFVRKKLKLLNQPLLVRNDKTSAIYRKKIQVWWCLIQCLEKEIWSCLDTVVIPFLKFCFGIVIGQPFLTSYVPAPSPEKTLGKKEASLSHWKLDPVNHPVLMFVLFELLRIEPTVTNEECIKSNSDLTPLPVLVVDSTRIFLHLSQLLIFSVGECVLLIAKNSEHEQKVKQLWNALLRHVCLAVGSRRSSDAQDKVVEVVKDVQHVLRGLVDQAKAIPSLAPHILESLMMEVLEGPHKLPADVLVSHVFDAGSTDLMNGTPALFLVELLLSPSLLFVLEKKLFCSHRAQFKAVVQLCVGVGMARSLHFTQAVIKRLDAVVQEKVLYEEHALGLWQVVAKQLLRFVMAGGDVNQGSDANHDFLCMYAMLLFPLHHHRATCVDQVDKLMDTWSRLYSMFVSQAHQCLSVEVNEVGEFISTKICSILKKSSLTAQQLLVFASAVRDVVNSVPCSIINQMPSKKRSTPLMRNKSEKPLANISSTLHVVSNLVPSLRNVVQWEELFSRVATLVIQSVSSLLKMVCAGNAEALFLQLAPLIASLLELPPGTPDMGRQLHRLWAGCTEFVVANKGHFAIQKITESLVMLTLAALQSHNHQVKRDALKFAVETVQNIFKSELVPVPTSLTKAVERCSNDDVFAGDEVDENSQSSVKPIKLAGSFLAKISGSDGQLLHNAQESVKSPVKTGTGVTPLKKTAQVTVLKSSPSTPLSLKKRPLTVHQREVMRKRRDDIPALYEDLTQDSQEREFIDSQEDSVSLETVPTCIVKSTLSCELRKPDCTGNQNEEEAIHTPVPPDKNVPKTAVDNVCNTEEKKAVKELNPIMLETNAMSSKAEKRKDKSCKKDIINNDLKSDHRVGENTLLNSCKNPEKTESSENGNIAIESIIVKRDCSAGDEVTQSCSAGEEVTQSCSAGEEVTQSCSKVATGKGKHKNSKGVVKKLSNSEGKTAINGTEANVTRVITTVTEATISETNICAKEKTCGKLEVAKLSDTNDSTCIKATATPTGHTTLGDDSVPNGVLLHTCHGSIENIKTSSLDKGMHDCNNVSQRGEAVATELTKLLSVVSHHSSSPVEVAKKNVVVEKVPSEQLPDGVLTSTQRHVSDWCVGKSRGRRKSSRPIKRNNPNQINFKRCMYLTKPQSPGRKLRSRKISDVAPKNVKGRKLTKTERDANERFVKFVATIGTGNEIIDKRILCNATTGITFSVAAVPISTDESNVETVNDSNSNNEDDANTVVKIDMTTNLVAGDIANSQRDAVDKNELVEEFVDDDFSSLTDALILELSKSAGKNNKASSEIENESSVQEVKSFDSRNLDPDKKSDREDTCVANASTSKQADMSSSKSQVGELKEVTEKARQATSARRRSSRICKGKHSRNRNSIFVKLPSSPSVKFKNCLQNKSNLKSNLSNAQLGVHDNINVNSCVSQPKHEDKLTSCEQNPTNNVDFQEPSNTCKESKCNNTVGRGSVRSNKSLQKCVSFLENHHTPEIHTKVNSFLPKKCSVSSEGIGSSNSNTCKLSHGTSIFEGRNAIDEVQSIEADNTSCDFLQKNLNHSISNEDMLVDSARTVTTNRKGTKKSQFCERKHIDLVSANKTGGSIGEKCLKGSKVSGKRSWNSAFETSMEICESSPEIGPPKLECDSSVEDNFKSKQETPSEVSEQYSGMEPQVKEYATTAASTSPVVTRGRKRRKLSTSKQPSNADSALPKSPRIKEGNVNHFEDGKNKSKTSASDRCSVNENSEPILDADKLGKKAELVDDVTIQCGSVKRKSKSPSNSKNTKISKQLKNKFVATSNIISDNVVQSTHEECQTEEVSRGMVICKETNENEHCRQEENIGSSGLVCDLKLSETNRNEVSHNEGRLKLFLEHSDDCNELLKKVERENADVTRGIQERNSLVNTKVIQCKSSPTVGKNNLIENCQLRSPKKNRIDIVANVNKSMVYSSHDRNKSRSPLKMETSFANDLRHGGSPKKMGGSEIMTDSVTLSNKCSPDLRNKDKGLVKDDNFSQDLIESSQDVALQNFAMCLNLRKCSVALNGLTVVDNKIIDQDKKTVVALASNSSFKLSPSYRRETCVPLPTGNISPVCKKINFDEEAKCSHQVESIKHVGNSGTFPVKDATHSPRKDQVVDNNLGTDKVQSNILVKRNLRISKKIKFSIRNTSYSVMKSKTRDFKCVDNGPVDISNSNEESVIDDDVKDNTHKISLDEGIISPVKPISRSVRMLNSVQSLLRNSCVNFPSQNNLRCESVSHCKSVQSVGVDVQVKLPIGKLNDSVSIFVTRNVALDDTITDGSCCAATACKQELMSPVKCTSPLTRFALGEMSPSNKSRQLLKLKSRTAHILNMTKTEQCLGEDHLHNGDVTSVDDDSLSSSMQLQLDEGVIAHSPDGKVRVKEWKRHTYSPVATPRNSSLKRMREGMDSTSPPAKKKSVSFSDPPRSMTLVFSRVVGEVNMEEVKKNTRPRRRVSMYSNIGEVANIDGFSPHRGSEDVLPTQQCSEENGHLESQGSVEEKMDRLIVEHNRNPFYAPLRDCSEPVEKIAKLLVPKLWTWKLSEFFETCNIISVGDLAALPMWVMEDGLGSFLDPGYVRKVLKDFESQLVKNSAKLEESAYPIEQSSSEVESVEPVKHEFLSGSSTSDSSNTSSLPDGNHTATRGTFSVSDSDLPAFLDSSKATCDNATDDGLTSSDHRGPTVSDPVLSDADRPMSPKSSLTDAVEPSLLVCGATTPSGSGDVGPDWSEHSGTILLDSCGSDSLISNRISLTSGDTISTLPTGATTLSSSDDPASTSSSDTTSIAPVSASAVSKSDDPTSSSEDITPTSSISASTLLNNDDVPTSSCSSTTTTPVSETLPNNNDLSISSIGVTASSSSDSASASSNDDDAACSSNGNVLSDSASLNLPGGNSFTPVGVELDSSHDDAVILAATAGVPMPSVATSQTVNLLPDVATESSHQGEGACGGGGLEDLIHGERLEEGKELRQPVHDKLEMALGILKSIPGELIRQRAGDMLMAVGDILSALGKKLNLS